MKAGPSVQVDVVSDVVCPWCYIGKRRLARVAELLPEVSLAVRWRPFRLDPTIPQGGIAREEYLSRKFGSVEAVMPMHQRLAEMGAAEAIDFRFDRITRSPNTIDAHRVIRWADAAGSEDDIVERLFHAYFTEGRDVGDQAVLAEIGSAAGLNADDVASRLASDEDRADVEAEVNEAYRIGVTGVPCFIVDQTYAVIGAHPGEIIADAIRQAIEQRAGADL